MDPQPPNYHTTPSFLQTLHRTAYPAISPTQASLPAAGKTIVITGGATGIGFSIARNFAVAGASTIVLLARRAETLSAAKEKLEEGWPGTKVLVHAVSITDAEGVGAVFADVREKVGEVDVLVTSAAVANTVARALDVAVEEYEGCFETNVIGNLNVVRGFLEGGGKDGKEKIILDVSSLAAWNPLSLMAPYGISKSAFSLLLRHIQVEHPEVRTHSFHPGAVHTPNTEKFGVPKDAFEWDDEELPGQFAVWLASEQARFLKGRCVMSRWDVGELMQNKEAFEKDPTLATVWLNLGVEDGLMEKAGW